MGNQQSSEQAKFNAVFYGTEAPLVIFKGSDMTFEMVNNTYQSIYPGRDLLGKPLLAALPELENTAFPGILKRVYETGENFISREGAVDLTNKLTGQNEVRYFNTTFSRIDYGNGEDFRILATPHEVTDKVIARQNLEQSLEQLEAEKELREKFVSALTHDLRTPLAVIKISSQILTSKMLPPEVFNKSVNRIMNNVDRADRMIRDLLDATRLRANEGLPLVIQQHQLEAILEHAVSDLEDLHGKRFVIQNPHTGIDVHIDNMAVHRMIENLASNAIKYGSEDQPVTISVTCEKDWFEISVHNHGNPIAPEDQKLLFQPFQRTDFAKASKQKGWGIGLTLVQGLAHAHHGTITFESGAEHGTKFIIRLPIDARN